MKRNSDGTVEQYKIRLVILGNTQLEGEFYIETFAPVVELVSVRTLLSIVVAKGWKLHQMDVHNAFLYGNLTEEVYMKFFIPLRLIKFVCLRNPCIVSVRLLGVGSLKFPLLLLGIASIILMLIIPCLPIVLRAIFSVFLSMLMV